MHEITWTPKNDCLVGKSPDPAFIDPIELQISHLSSYLVIYRFLGKICICGIYVECEIRAKKRNLATTVSCLSKNGQLLPSACQKEALSLGQQLALTLTRKDFIAAGFSPKEFADFSNAWVSAKTVDK